MACEALLRLAAYTDQGSYRDSAEQALKTIGEAAIRYPTAFARWLSAADFALGNVKQIAVLGDAQGENFQTLINVIRNEYRPNTVTAASTFPPQKGAPALLQSRPLVDGKASAYVCEGFICKQPLTKPGDLESQLKHFQTNSAP